MVLPLYTHLAQTALTLITKYGRAITLQFAADGTLADANKPWEPATPTLTTFVATGVVVPSTEVYAASSAEGTIVEGVTEVALLAAKGMPLEPDMKTIVLDGLTRYKVTKVDSLNPGPVKLVYILSLKR